ncbi:hypothetical protein [Streptacidiphilus jiangxiensis]|uniref:Uncharacterized protein n=1 Tax=Streptacidiphilus jiangxiensis TaxID=235985 RepID=A0A1H7ZVN9_STRJI|nr:hypothetical protein [Streptacidiphilus jiangxiensis]SEM62520.1 hypothetical protein SAMN05414137_13839 [Streptacidiphilus jiangxiensis]
MEQQADPYRPAVVRFAGDVEVDGRTFSDNMRLAVWIQGDWIHVRVPGTAAPHYCLPVHAVAGVHWED